MKNNSKKTNKQNTARSVQHSLRRTSHRTKDERRAMLLTKKHVKMEHRRTVYGVDHGTTYVLARGTEMNRRFVAAFLALVFAISCFVVGFSFSGKADNNISNLHPAPTDSANKGLHLEKYLTPNDNGTYKLSMEAYATGTVKKYNEQIPTDYVLVADQSGSMTTKDVPTGGWTGKTTNWYCPQDPDTVLNTYYKETDANGVDHYYRVYRKRGELFQYHAPNTVYIGECVDDLGWFQRETTQLDSDGANSPYWYNPSLDTSNKPIGNTNDNHFYPLMISSQGGLAEYWIRFRFTDATGTKRALQWTNDIWYKRPEGGYFKPGERWGGVITYDFADRIAKNLADNDPNRYTFARIGMDVPFAGWVGLSTGMYVRQVTFTRFVGYNQLAYKDDNGVEHLLMDMTYCDGNGTPVGGQCDSNTGVPTGGMTSTSEAYWYGTLYTPDENQNITRLQALQAAMTEFVNTVSTQENDDDTKPNHRVAIVGFSGEGHKNTELLTGLNINTSASNKNGVRYASITEQQYKDALLDVTDPAQLAKLQNAVQALDADGGTEGEYGLYMAKNILDKRELTKFTTRGGQEVDRLTIIVYFTDGTPGPYEYSNQYEYGNKVIDAAHQIKTDANIPGVEIYSIGTFGFADADPLTYQKHSGSNDAKYQYDPDYVGKMSSLFNNRYIYRIWLRNTQGYGDIATDTVSDYMRTITSEFKNATQFVDPTWYNENATKSDNGVYTDMVQRVRGDSNGLRRYYLCTDLSALSRVFTIIGSEEASASSTVNLLPNNSCLLDYFTDDFLATDTTTVSTKIFKPSEFNSEDGSVKNWVEVDASDTGAIISSSWERNDGGDITGIRVVGFDYTNNNYVAPYREEGRKLVVTIDNLEVASTRTDESIMSNMPESGIYSTTEEGIIKEHIEEFPQPSISRHSYTIKKGQGVQEAAVNFTIVDENGDPIDPSELTDVVIQSDKRYTYDQDRLTNISGSENGTVIYLENLPAGAKVKSEVEYSAVAGYDATLSVKQDETDVSASTDTTYITPYADGDVLIEVTAEANERPAVITMKTQGVEGQPTPPDYSDSTKQFPIKITIGSDTADVPATLTRQTASGDTTEDITLKYDAEAGGYSKYVDSNEETHDLSLADGEKVQLNTRVGNVLGVEETESAEYNTTVNNVSGLSGNITVQNSSDANDNKLAIVNTLKENPVITGITDSDNHNWIVYILAAVAGLSAIGAGIFLWKKRNEFTEE